MEDEHREIEAMERLSRKFMEHNEKTLGRLDQLLAGLEEFKTMIRKQFGLPQQEGLGFNQTPPHNASEHLFFSPIENDITAAVPDSISVVVYQPKKSTPEIPKDLTPPPPLPDRSEFISSCFGSHSGTASSPSLLDTLSAKEIDSMSQNERKGITRVTGQGDFVTSIALTPTTNPPPKPPDRIVVPTPSLKQYLLVTTTKGLAAIRCPEVHPYTMQLTARQLFDQMPKYPIVVWNAIITGCTDKGHEGVAFDLFKDTHRMDIEHGWHKFGYTLLGMSLGRNNRFASLYSLFEKHYGKMAVASLCVTKALQHELAQNWGINATILYEQPPDFFHLVSLEERHKLFCRLNAGICEPLDVKDCVSNGATLIDNLLQNEIIFTTEFMIVAGVSLAYVSGTVLSWRALALTDLIPTAVLLLGQFFILESPRWLAKRGRVKDFEAALQILRGKDADISQEDDEIQDYITTLERLPKPNLLGLIQRRYMRSLTIGVGLMVCQQLWGVNGVCFYTNSIFELAEFSSTIGTIIYACLQDVITGLGAVLIDRAGSGRLVCVAWAILRLGKALYCDILKNRLENVCQVGSANTYMYAKCGRLDLAYSQMGVSRTKFALLNGRKLLDIADGKSKTASAQRVLLACKIEKYVAVLHRKMIDRGNVLVPKVLLKWKDLPPKHGTW